MVCEKDIYGSANYTLHCRTCFVKRTYIVKQITHYILGHGLLKRTYIVQQITHYIVGHGL